MEIIYFALIIIVLVLGFLLLRKFIGERLIPKNDIDSMLLLQNQINELSRIIDTKLGESNKVLREQFHQSAQASQQIIKEVTQELTKVTEGHKQVMGVTDQLKSLQDILKNPKQRGVLGEFFLETILENVLPPGTYQLQYPFKDGAKIEKVDAVIFAQEKVIPIDSKFSLENYNRIINASSDDERMRYEAAFAVDLKTRIEETSKYIRPHDNTYPFALMFIPSEAIFYDLMSNNIGVINSRNLIEYAHEKNVYPVSPNTFFVYLQTILHGLRQVEFNKSAEHIKKKVLDLQRHLSSYESFFKKLGDHLGTSMNMYTKAEKEFEKIDKDVVKITGRESDQLSLEQPLFDEE